MTTAKRVRWSDGGEWCNTCGIRTAVTVGECETCRKLVPVTVPAILECWRKQICFADAVKLEDGRYATVVAGGAVSPIMLKVVIGYPHEPAKGSAEVHRDTLFPAWWPTAQFAAHEPQGDVHAER